MAFSDQSKTVFIPSLESLCLTEYLTFLESACAGAQIGILIIFDTIKSNNFKEFSDHSCTLLAQIK